MQPQSFTTVLEAFKKVGAGCWMVAVSRHNKLTLDFKELLQWPVTPSIEEFREK